MEIPPVMAQELEIPIPDSLQENRIEEMLMAWVGRGPNRSYKWVADELHLPVSTIVSHARKFLWPARLARSTAKGNELTLDAMAQTVAQVQEKHITELIRLREKAFDKIVGMTLDEKDAIKLYLETLKAERLARGMDEKKDKGDLIELLAERLTQMQPAGQPALPAPTEEHEFEFELNENLEIEALEEVDQADDGMIPVKSSHLVSVRLTEDVLRVRFKDGSVYDYKGVTEALFAELMKAKSVGGFFAKKIKLTHEAIRVE